MHHIEDLRQALVLTTLKLEATQAATKGEARKREEQVIQFKDLLNRVLRDRDGPFKNT